MVLLGFVCIATFLQVVTSQEPPAHCLGPPPVDVRPHECCKLPKLFKDEDLKDCGFKHLDDEAPPKGPPPPGPPPSHQHDCTRHECLMKKYNALKDDGSVDFNAINGLLDKMVEENAEFKDATAIIKEECTSGKQLPGPPHICEADRLLHCINFGLTENCPNWKVSEDCTTLKNLMDECKPFHKKH